MDDDRTVISSGFVVTPEVVANRSFNTSFRGFDQSEVRAFLKKVSEDLAAAAEREAQLRRLLQEAQNKAAHPEVDEELITAALGEQAARLLGSAREQAASIRSEAEAKVSRLLRDAETQISRVRSEADSLLARRVEEVDGVTANLRKAAEADARALREQAKADAEAEIQAAKTQGREMVTEARAIRERILADLARRRYIAEVQLDQLRAARERLLDAYSLVRRTLEEATQELKIAEVEARLAAEDAGRRAGPPPPPPPPVTPPATGLDVGPQTGEHDAVPTSAPEVHGAPATTAATPTTGTPSPAPPALPAGTVPARGSNRRVRPPREPVPRSEPRLRPPSRPDESHPSPGWRRLGSSGPAPTGAPASPDRGGPVENALARKAPPPEPPSITPRPVPPPPTRSTAAASRGEASSSPSPPLAEPARPQPGEERPAEQGDKGDKVEAIFARIKADRASVVARSSRPAATPPVVPHAPHAPPEAPGDASVPAPPEPPSEQQRPPAAEGERPKEIAEEAARARRDELLEPPESTLVRQLKRALQDEQNEVLDQLRRQRRPTVENVLPALDQQLSRFRDAATPALADAVRAGLRFAGGEAQPDDPDLASAVASALASAVVEPLRDRLERQLPEQEADPATEPSQLSEAVSAAYRQWRTQELEPLARHHAADAFARGAFAAYPADTALRWVADGDARCPDCHDNELAGSVSKGEPYPTGQVHPPAHPGCRCLLLPAVP